MFGGKKSLGNPRKEVPTFRKNGKWLSVYETEGAYSLAAGSSQTIEQNFDVRLHSALHLHVWLDAEVTVTVEWRAGNGLDWITAPSPIVIPASVGAVGTAHEITVHSPYYRLTALNSDTVPLTFLKVSVYGNK